MTDICKGLLQIGNGENDYEACLFASSGTGAVEAILTSAISDKQKVLIQTSVEDNRIENGVHVSTGLIAGDNVMLVIQNCTGCHSSKMITQNRATKEGWLSMIKWMQKTQNLWDLGTNEDKIVDYLATNYPPQKKGRRAKLKNIEWYELD